MNKENEFNGGNLPIHQHYYLLLRRFDNLSDELEKVKREEFKLKTELSQFLDTPVKFELDETRDFQTNDAHAHLNIDFENYLKKIANLEQVRG